MKISLLLTGNELMSGDTVDSNSAYIAQSLKDLNLVPYIKKVVGDDMALLISSIVELSAVSDVLIINGGLGPTIDDLTAQALAVAIDSPIQRHAQAYQRLSEWASGRGFVLTESNLKQADLPSACCIIDNPNGSAVGFRCVYQDCLIMCTPGVPSELKPMVENHLLALIREHGAIEATSYISRLRLFGISESGLQDSINRIFPDWPSNVELGFRVQMPVLEIKIATVGDELIALNEHWVARFIEHFSDYIIGRGSTRLSQALNQTLRDKQLKIATAESCTGGLIAAGITSESGSSEVFEAGYVCYSNRMKTAMLSVDQSTLLKHGAVSEAVVTEMVKGAVQASGADIAIAISGIAGPSGGSNEKPVGTVWMAWGGAAGIKARKFYLPIPRQGFQRTATAIAMDLVRRHVLELNTDIDYFGELKKKSAQAIS